MGSLGEVPCPGGLCSVRPEGGVSLRPGTWMSSGQSSRARPIRFAEECPRRSEAATDPAGNSKLAKGAEGGWRLRAKDDALAAAILAVSAGAKHGGRAKRPRAGAT